MQKSQLFYVFASLLLFKKIMGTSNVGGKSGDEGRYFLLSIF